MLLFWFSEMKEVVFATTSAWDNLGLTVDKQKQYVEEHTNIIIGIMDTGINPEVESFSPDGINPLNSKIVGAKICYEPEGGDGQLSNTIRDDYGHGTNMASAAAGNFVEASIGKLKTEIRGVTGTARGVVPAARIAFYKITLQQSPTTIFSAIYRAAVCDKVDVLNISWGREMAEEKLENESFRYFDDDVALGTFTGILGRVLACAAAGNYFKYVTNIAPWILTVGACDAPTLFTTEVSLGSNKRPLLGYSMNRFEDTAFCPLIPILTAIIKEIPATASSPYRPMSLDSKKVRGKIVVGLTNGDNMQQAKRATDLCIQAGAAGIILIKYADGNPKFLTFPLPGAWMTKEDGEKILNYLQCKSPLAKISTSREITNNDYPVLAEFSPQRPNPMADFTKPDICAVGERLLVASHEKGKYCFSSGTSVATASVSGIVAFVKSIHPNWSPSAIKSAIMTTAEEMKVKTVADLERVGSGLISPLKALDPGLVYDLTQMDYLLFMKGKGEEGLLEKLYGVESMKHLGPEKSIQPQDFNYPSFRASLQGTNSEIVFQRKVKHVGLIEFSTYHVQVSTKPNLLEVDVVPNVLSFNSSHPEKSFKVHVRVRKWSEDGLLSATLVWKNERYTVRSPIIVVRGV
ncbi:hypothetical protein RHGRI_022197 [Rhododendron griersonianum]|uniref:Uncharacterized protein n=1 Tax=Rhododendron griersonianum TaxID=479676 RepID=A0AAV6JRY3_9ERIC|nr:hypothetical protein RHGRI_022197 [Rhododendron griersonianum]